MGLCFKSIVGNLEFQPEVYWIYSILIFYISMDVGNARTELDGQITDLLAKVEQAHTQALEFQVEAKKLFEVLDTTLDKVNDSWSGL